ncbi:MAG: insulinase family protein [Holophagales bacterium]|nr:insulinase family protein [Holophagales bacterium]
MNRFVNCGALLLAVSASCALGQAIPDRPEKLSYPPIAFQVPKAKDAKVVLKNRVPAYLVSDPTGVPLVRITVWWRGGAYMEPAGKEGLASLFGSQLAVGGTQKKDAAAVEDRLEALAATLSSTCGPTSGSLYLQVQEKDLAEGVDLLMQALTQPAFAQDRLDLAKKSARQGLERRNDAVTSIAQIQMPYLLFGEKFFATEKTTAASLDAITREDLLAFHAGLLHPANLAVAVSGKFEKKAMVDLLNRTVGAIAAGKTARPSPKVPEPDFVRAPGLYVCDKDAPQAMLQWAFPGMRRSDPDWYPAMVMNHVLGGGGFTARLMKKIRSDEGLTYGVRTTLGEGPHWRGDLTGGLQTKNTTVAYALRLALAEMQRLKDEALTEAELASVKDGLVESFPAQWASRQAIANRFAEEQLNGWPEDWWVDYREKVRAVTAEDVRKLAKRLLEPEKMVVLAVGKAAEVESGDPDHPGALKDAVRLPLSRVPLRDPLTLKPLP